MKKTLKLISIMLVLVALCSMVVACSNVSQGYADKINQAAKDGEAYTLEQISEDLGDEAIKIIAPVINTGVVVAVKGCTTLDEIQEKIDAGKDVKGIIIAIAGNKAISAEYRVITAEDLKK